MASIQKHYDPWNPRLLELNEAQLDAILELYSIDHPKELKFERRKKQKDRQQTEDIALDWSEKLTGKAREAWKSKVSFKVPDHFKAYRKQQAEQEPAPPLPVNQVRGPRRKQ